MAITSPLDFKISTIEGRDVQENAKYYLKKKRPLTHQIYLENDWIPHVIHYMGTTLNN